MDRAQLHEGRGRRDRRTPACGSRSSSIVVLYAVRRRRRRSSCCGGMSRRFRREARRTLDETRRARTARATRSGADRRPRRCRSGDRSRRRRRRAVLRRHRVRAVRRRRLRRRVLGPDRRRRASAASGPRALIDHSIGPVWEANHVWLIFCLVVLWTAFSRGVRVDHAHAVRAAHARRARHRAARLELRVPQGGRRARRDQRNFGAAFALSSVLVPFCMGAVAGAIASGRVPAGGKAGDPWSSWINPTSILGGVLAVDRVRVPRGGVPRLGRAPPRRRRPGRVLPPPRGRRRGRRRRRRVRRDLRAPRRRAATSSTASRRARCRS